MAQRRCADHTRSAESDGHAHEQRDLRDDGD